MNFSKDHAKTFIHKIYEFFIKTFKKILTKLSKENVRNKV
jgi:hypothetical protein